MAYIKIYDKNLMPIGVAETSSIEVIENGERYVKIKNAKGLIDGAINIDAELTTSEATRLVTVYNSKMLPIGVADIADIIGNESSSSSSNSGSIDDSSSDGVENPAKQPVNP